MSLKIHFPEDIEEFAAALDGISEATAQAAQDGPQSLAAFRLGVRVALAAMIKTTGGAEETGRQGDRGMGRRISPSPCPLKGIYADESNGYYCRFYRERCPMLENPAYNYLTCPGWREYESNKLRMIYA